MAQSLSASSALDLLARQTHAMIDVRSELEFATGAIPGFILAPILHDQERHAVGLCYRQEGQAAAIELGHRLVDPSRSQRVEHWIQIGSSKPAKPLLVACWRGGLRSQIATRWIEEAGREQQRIEGGYKAIRQEILKILAEPPPLLVLSGMTGSGKTNLLVQVPFPEKMDIEDLAAHRGSSFGKIWNRSQPAQATFENALGLALRQQQRPVLVEDESKVIGRLHLPEPLRLALLKSPVVLLEVPVIERCFNIFTDYVARPLTEGLSAEALQSQLIESVQKLQRRLGGALTARVITQIKNAFSGTETAFEQHVPWIETLLKDYYDRSYDHASARNQRPIAFRGSYEECRQWILQQYV